MPKAYNRDHLPRIVQAVNDAIRTDNDLADEWVFKLRHNPAKLWRSLKQPGPRNKKPTKFKCAVRRVEGDITDDVTQVSPGQRAKGLPDNP